MDKFINSVGVSRGDISKQGETRPLTIYGSNNADFILQIVSSEGKFYNFTTNAFTETTHTPQNKFSASLNGDTFIKTIKFPSVTSETTYNIIVIPDHTKGVKTRLTGGVSNISLTQVVDVTLTFGFITSSASNYNATPPAANITTVGSPLQKGSTTVSVSKTVTNAATDNNGHGLRLTSFPTDSSIVFRKDTTLSGTTSSSTILEVASAADLAVGMYLIVGPNLSGTPQISSISGTKIELTTAQTLNSDGATLTFEARGAKSIYSAIGVGISSVKLKVEIPSTGEVTSTVRGAISNSTTITLNGTYGIAGGNFVTYDGAGVDSSTANAVTSVTDRGGGNPPTTLGEIVVQKAQTLSDGTPLTFKGSTTAVNIVGTFDINYFGTSDRTISLDLDKFITVGAAS
tara:strand:+ start:3894 stop:5099 length:1206 start_codon:yes stop_codon:yes gene_type:complete